MKSNAKKKASNITKSKNATGGGPATSIELTTSDEAILSQMSEAEVSGHAEVQETLIVVSFKYVLHD